MEDAAPYTAETNLVSLSVVRAQRARRGFTPINHAMVDVAAKHALKSPKAAELLAQLPITEIKRLRREGRDRLAIGAGALTVLKMLDQSPPGTDLRTLIKYSIQHERGARKEQRANMRTLKAAMFIRQCNDNSEPA